MARPKRNITPEQIKQIETLAGYGLTDEHISDVVGIPESSIKAKCKEVLATGRSKALAAVTQSAYRMAVDGKNPAMTMFYLKCRARWRETDKNNEMETDTPAPTRVEIIVKEARRGVE